MPREMQTKVEMVIKKSMVLGLGLCALFVVLCTLFFSSVCLGSSQSNFKAQNTKPEVQSSYFDPQNLPHDQHAGGLQKQGGGDQVMAALILPKDGHVFGVHHGDDDGDKYR